MEWSEPQTLHRAFEAQARRTPDAIAVSGGAEQVTYAELDHRANGIAQVLRSSGAGPDVPVGVLLDRSPALVAGLLGILKAGSPYLPLETSAPPARVARLLRDSGAVACLTTAQHQSTLADGSCLPVLADAGTPSATVVPDLVLADHLAAVYYTSGSTGSPKGVACTHRGWLNRMRWMQDRHGLAPGDPVLHKTTLTFDDSAVEVFWPLLTGATVALLPPGLHRDARAIIDAAISSRSAHVQFVPSVLDLFLAELTEDDLTGLAHLRSVLSSGEALRPELVRRFREKFGERVSLDNTWGATEVSIDSTFHICTAEDGIGDGVVSLGLPLSGNEVRVLDAVLDPVPDGTVGELVIGGIGLARGYAGRPSATAAAFVPDPDGHGERLYRTGDRGLRTSDGRLQFRDRVDNQVKVQGVRIELGEIEAALREHPGVADAAARVWEPQPGDRRLAGYAVPHPGTTLGADELRDHLRRTLPGSMVPASILVLAELSRHANGKLDRHALPVPEVPGTEAGYIAPRTLTEQILATLWADVLGTPSPGIEDDFFGVGGHSLLAMRLLGRMRRAFGTDALPLNLVFDSPTIAAAAARIEQILLTEISPA